MKIKIDGNTMRQAVQELAKRDGDLAAFHRQHGLPGLRTRPTGFGTLLKIICGQQVSTAAARAITRRLDSYAAPMTPEIFLSLQKTDYRAIGLSRQKEVYGRGIAEAVVSGDFNFRKIAQMEDESAIAEMTKLKGVGRWTAEVYLLFALRRPDLWPADDLGVLNGYIGLKGLSSRPSRAEFREIGEQYRPWRSVMARMLWHHANTFRGTGQTN